MTHSFFITGTDTDVGKTVVASLLTLFFKAHYWKPIQSGNIHDTDEVKRLTELSKEHFLPSAYSFQAPLSPNQAAQKENEKINLFKCALPNVPSLIVEGAGGVYVPLNETHTMMDLIKQLNLHIIVVARGTLGTINHTLLTLTALKRHEVSIAGIVFNGELNPDNQENIEHFSKVKTLFHVPTFKEVNHTNLKSWLEQHKRTFDDIFS